MTQKSLDTLSKAPVGSTVEVEGRKIKLQALDDWQASGDWCACHGCACETTRDCDAQDPPICDAEVRDDNINVRFLDITNCPWQDWPDAHRDGMCEIPVVIARNLRAIIDETTLNQWILAGLNANDTIEATIYLDNAINGAKGESKERLTRNSLPHPSERG